THPEPQAEDEGIGFVLEGSVGIQIGGQTEQLSEGGFAYLPAGDSWQLRATGDAPARFQWRLRRYEQLEGYTPTPQLGEEQDIEPAPMPGTNNAWRTTRLLDPSNLAYDMHVNVVTFEPGAVIPFAETHVMEHGIYVLEGKAVYRLNTDWVEVEAGDYFSLRAFCPQACYAGGPANFRYLLYKDVNRQVML